MKNRKVMDDLMIIFGHPKKDWMGYKISKANFLSYHHIDEKRNGGEETIDNGAILTRISHRLLHQIELDNNELYQRWKELFIEINASKKPLDGFFYGKIGELRRLTKEFYINKNSKEQLTLVLK